MKLEDFRSLLASPEYELKDEGDDSIIIFRGSHINSYLHMEVNEVASLNIEYLFNTKITSLCSDAKNSDSALNALKGLNLVLNSYEPCGHDYDFLAVKTHTESRDTIVFKISSRLDIFDGVIGRQQLLKFFTRFNDGIGFIKEKIEEWK